MRVMQGKGEQDTQAWKDAMRQYAEKIEFYDLPTRIEKDRFINKLYTKIIEIIGRSWDFWYGLTIRYKDQNGNPNAPIGYHTLEGYTLGKWQSHQRQNYKTKKLSLDRIQRLEAIDFTWGLFDKKFEKGFQETLKYREQAGDPNAPIGYKTQEGYRLGSWQSSQRKDYKNGGLSHERIQRLESISFKWALLDELFEKNFQETLKYREQAGDPNVPANYKTPEGYTLRNWQSHQRQNYKTKKLSLDRIQRLESIGFKWVLLELDEKFEKGFQETLKYREQAGDPNVPANYKTPEGYTLWNWHRSQRNVYSRNKLSSDRIRRLEAIGFKWGLLDEKFEKGFQETLKFKKTRGYPNASHRYITPEGFRLAQWQAHQRNNFIAGKLSPERIQRLEDIGFKWVLLDLDEKFEKGFQATLDYKAATGDPNAPQGYKTQEGYRLGSWQGTQRYIYRKGKLSKERIERLEKIGFKWIMGALDEKFEKGFQATLDYKEATGDPNTSYKYKTKEGYRLRVWQDTQRTRYNKDKLSPDRIQRLEDIGFKWVLLDLDEKFEKGFQATLDYKQDTGDPNAPKYYKTPEGYKLGSWQSSQRKDYKNGKLTLERVQRLESIGFSWGLRDKWFEKGFQATLDYKQDTGDPNAPKYYKTPEGYKLGRWQGTQRYLYRKGKLSKERIEILEKIGFSLVKQR